MKNKKLSRSFYTQPTLAVAKKLLGKYIVRKIGKKKLAGKIVETEAYIGPRDRASHAFGGKITPRNRAEYLVGGHIYIYLVYGMHWQLNISTSKAGKPECALIRALDLGKTADGPGKVCRYLKLNKSFYGEDLTKSKRIWLEDGGVKMKIRRLTPAVSLISSAKRNPPKQKNLRVRPRAYSHGLLRRRIKPSRILATPRIGIDYAGPYWSRRKWRFVLNAD